METENGDTDGEMELPPRRPYSPPFLRRLDLSSGTGGKSPIHGEGVFGGSLYGPS